MELAIELFGNLILTFLGFVVPIVGILLSMFQSGTSILITRYENEKKQTKKNIQNLSGGELEEEEQEEIQGNLDKLKETEKEAARKLSLLNPRKQLLRLTVPLVFTFLSILISCFTNNQEIAIYQWKLSLAYIPLSIATILFIFALYVLWGLSGIIIEIKSAMDESRSEGERKYRQELLSALGRLLREVFILVNNKKVGEKGLEIELPSQEELELKISVRNSETRMAKNVEIGFVFPPDFIIREVNSYSIYKGEDNQIVRYTLDSLHGNTRQILRPLLITPLKKGTFKIKTFIKAENIETLYRNLTLKIV